MSSSLNTSPVRMEINGCPFYIKSKNNVPYIYDVDTHDEVGYWSSKKGAYVMFSLYNKLMNDLRKKKETESSACESESSLDEEDEQEEGEEGEDEEEEEVEEEEDEQEEGEEGEEGEEDEEEEECEESKTNADVVDSIQEKLTTNYSIVMLFVILFIYLILQKELQSIYFDFVFIILINLLNTLKTFEILNDE